jgi:hypothetical protein
MALNRQRRSDASRRFFDAQACKPPDYGADMNERDDIDLTFGIALPDFTAEDSTSAWSTFGDVFDPLLEELIEQRDEERPTIH